MVFEGKAQRIVHSKLGPNAVYVTREGCYLHKLAVEIENDTIDLRDNGNFSEEADRILTEAAMLAEIRIKERYPRNIANRLSFGFYFLLSYQDLMQKCKKN